MGAKKAVSKAPKSKSVGGNGGTVDTKHRSNAAMRRAISFSRITLLTNIVYFVWRASAIARCMFAVGPAQVALYVGLLIVEWTFAGE